MERKRPRRMVVRLIFLFSTLVLVPLALTSVVLTLLGQQALNSSSERIADAGQKRVMGASDESIRQARKTFAELTQQVNDTTRQTLQAAGHQQVEKNRAVLNSTTHRIVQQGQRLIRQSHQQQARAFRQTAHQLTASLQSVHRDAIRVAQGKTIEQGVRAVSAYGSELVAMSADALEQQAVKLHQERAQRLTLEVDAFLEETMRSLRHIAALPAVQSLDPARAPSDLQAAMERHRRLQAIAVLDRMGAEVVKLPQQAVLSNRRESHDYLWAINGHEYISPSMASSGEKAHLVLSVPIVSGAERVGVVTADVSLEPLGQVLRQDPLGSGAYAAYIANQNYDVITHSEPQTRLGRVSSEDLPVALRSLRDSTHVSTQTDRADEKEEVFRASAPVNDERIRGRWAVVVVQPKKDAIAAVRKMEERLKARVQETERELKTQSFAHADAALNKAIRQGNAIENAALTHAQKASERLTQSATQQVRRAAQRLTANVERQLRAHTQQGIQSANRHIEQESNVATRKAVARLQRGALLSAKAAAAQMEDAVRRASGASARTMSKSALVLSLLFLMGALTLAALTARSFAQPLSRLADGARSIAQGDYARRVETAAPDAELVQLAEAFNTMAAAVASSRAQLEDANRHLFEEKQKLDTIIARMPDGLIVTDATGRVVVMNAAARALLGLHSGELLLREADLASIVTELPPSPEVSHLPSPGKKLCEATNVLSRSGRTIQVSTAPVTDEAGQTLGRVRVLHDITQEREVNQLKTEFLSLVTHELRTPLTSILGFTTLMLEGKQGQMTEAQAKTLSTVQRQARRLAALINDLLDISRIEVGRAEMEREPVPVDEIADSVLEELRPQAQQKGIKLRLNAPPTPCMARGDYQRLTQVFVNLLGNAIKFTPEEGRVAVSITPQSGRILVEVSDTGIGIPPDELGRVFDKFYQVRRSAERKTNGTGLGLAIVKGIVETHGGNIWVQSQEGRGTKFLFTLPAVQ